MTLTCVLTLKSQIDRRSFDFDQKRSNLILRKIQSLNDYLVYIQRDKLSLNAIVQQFNSRNTQSFGFEKLEFLSEEELKNYNLHKSITLKQ